jgi:hypothetical protein
MTDTLLSIPPEKITLDTHRQHPEISLERYVRAKSLTTSDKVLARKIIYLDTRYWILLREVVLDRSADTTLQKILSKLRYLVADGTVICPINADILVELLKQSDETTRLAMARLIDDLSLGTALQSEEERVGTELMHCVQLHLRGPAALEPQERLVWTSPSYVLGYVFPITDSFSDEEMLVCQKAFTDYLWDFPLADAISMLPPLPEQMTARWKAIADKLNSEIKQHDLQSQPFVKLHVDEFKGALDGYLSTLTNIFSHLYEKEIGVAPTEEGRVHFEDAARQLVGILGEALRTGKLGRQLPSLVTKAGLHAGVRRNRGRQFTGNDLHDFGHATAALAYCHYFATDKKLRHLVVNDLKFDERYNVAVVSEPSEFLRLIEQIL